MGTEDQLPATMELGDLLTSASGYGYWKKTIDCNSAIALLGLLGLIELLRDLIQQMVPTTGRRRRSLAHNILGFGSGVKDQLPGVLLPLLHSLVDSADGFLPPECTGRAICEANGALATSDPLVGQLLANLLTQVSGRALLPGQGGMVGRAGRAGRDNSTACATLYPACTVPPEYLPHYGLLSPHQISGPRVDDHLSQLIDL